MTDYIGRALLDANINPNENVLVSSNLPAGTIITDWEMSVAAALYVLVTGATYPGQFPANLAFGWQVVAHGATPTSMVESNILSGPWVSSREITYTSASTAAMQSGGSESYFFFTFTGHSKFWLPQQLTAASDVYLSLFSPWPAYYSEVLGISGTGIIWYHGP